jgi:dipeptide/tripeptide permease
MTPSYWLLGQPSGFWGFFFVFLLVAIGAATFKPVVVGTVAHTTTEKNKAMGFGIFYMMVNIGGFAGPIVAGIVRNNLGWPWVFNMSAIWIAFNFVWLFLFYKEPEGRASA